RHRDGPPAGGNRAPGAAGADGDRADAAAGERVDRHPAQAGFHPGGRDRPPRGRSPVAMAPCTGADVSETDVVDETSAGAPPAGEGERQIRVNGQPMTAMPE